MTKNSNTADLLASALIGLITALGHGAALAHDAKNKGEDPNPVEMQKAERGIETALKRCQVALEIWQGMKAFERAETVLQDIGAPGAMPPPDPDEGVN